MQRLTIFTLIAAWFTIGTAAAVPRGLAPDADRHPTIKVESGDPLQQAVAAIPVKASTSITPQQEADLHNWLYDFLVAFSASGSDSLAAAFYLRGGVNPDGIAEIKRQLAAIKRGGPLTAQQLRAMGTPLPELPVGATPFDLFKAMHRFGVNIKRGELHINRRSYFFGNVSFFASAYRVFELQGDYYESYRDYAQTHGLLSTRSAEWSPELRGQIEEGLKLGGQWVAAEFMFMAEEPAEFAGYAEPVRHPFFVRLVWHPRQAMWRLVEAFTPNDAPVLFLFNAT